MCWASCAVLCKDDLRRCSFCILYWRWCAVVRFNTAVILFLMAVTGQYGPHYDQRELLLPACLSHSF